MSTYVIRADSGCLPLPDASVDLIVTSPPYFGLRSYTDGGEHYAGQVGDEDTPTAYLDRLLACTAEWMRVLKPSGSIFVNLGDKYSQRVATRRSSHQDGLFPDRPELEKDWKRDKALGLTRMPYQNVTDPATGQYVPEKSLMMLPARYAIRCVDELGLIQRAEIIWAKPNGLPESVTDRVRRSHEQVFHFTKQGRYFSGVDEIREPHLVGLATGAASRLTADGSPYRGAQTMGSNGHNLGLNPLGKLPGSVWTIPTAPLKVPASLGVDHFAAYPPELVKRIVLGWSPREVCTACGEGRAPVSERSTIFDKARDQEHATQIAQRGAAHGVMSGGTARSTLNGTTTRTVIGYSCACPDMSASSTTGVVLDPFGGTGTTALVASCYGRTGISVDLSHDYSRLAQWRTSSGAERARVLGVEKPAEQIDGQGDLFGDAA